MKFPDDENGFRDNARMDLRFTGYVFEGKILNNFYGELNYKTRQGEKIREQGMFNQNILLNGIGKRTFVGLFTAIGDFKNGKLNGNALKDYENFNPY
jgi:hypothetical protein